MKKLIPIFAFLLLGPTALLAQKPFAFAGPYGVFIRADKLLHGPQYVIERLETGQGKPEWQPVGTTDKAPASADELIARLTLLAAKNPLYELPVDSLMRPLYQRYRAISHADSLGAYGTHPQYLEAFGLGLLDTEVKQGTRYDYRLRAADERDGVYHHPGTVSVPGNRPATTARSITHSADGRQVRIQYLIKKQQASIAGARVLRATFGQTGYETCGAEWGFRKGQRDSLFLIVTDRNVRRKMLYSYVVHLQDILGNESVASDTLTIVNLRPQDAVPVVQQISTRSVEADNAIAVSWKLSSLNDLRSVEIWRSEQFDGVFRQIGTAPATDTVYLDHAVEPVRGYYYQIRPNGAYEKSGPSVKVAGMLQANRPALVAPTHFQLQASRDSLFFRWQPADFDTRGYYIYFAAGQTDSLKRYSDLIPAQAALKFQLPLHKLATGVGYRWAVVAENTSYQLSPASNVVYSEPRFPDRLATPINPEIVPVDGGALVVWENMKPIDPYILGYTVERKADTDKAFKEIYRQQGDDIAHNYFTDSTVRAGTHYLYRVRAYGLGQKLSAFSTNAAYFKPLDPVLPVHGLNVVSTSKGVLLSWDAPLSKPEKFLVYRYTEKTEKPRLISAPPGSQTALLDRDAVPGVGYYYHVVAVAADKRESSPTDPVKIDWN